MLLSLCSILSNSTHSPARPEEETGEMLAEISLRDSSSLEKRLLKNLRFFLR